MSNYIPDGIFKQYYEVVDELLENSATSFSCRLYYSPIISECTNCLFTYGSSSNIYKQGGPEPFSIGLCPVCNGKGTLEIESTENIRLRVHEYTQSKMSQNYKLLNKNIQNPEGILEIRGRKEDIPKLLKSQRILVASGDTQFGPFFYKLTSEPIPHGFGYQYFFALIERV
jgi:hypothetical protein